MSKEMGNPHKTVVLKLLGEIFFKKMLGPHFPEIINAWSPVIH